MLIGGAPAGGTRGFRSFFAGPQARATPESAMTAPIRSASGSSLAAARPQVLSRRVSLRVGSVGLT